MAQEIIGGDVYANIPTPTDSLLRSQNPAVGYLEAKHFSRTDTLDQAIYAIGEPMVNLLGKAFRPMGREERAAYNDGRDQLHLIMEDGIAKVFPRVDVDLNRMTDEQYDLLPNPNKSRIRVRVATNFDETVQPAEAQDMNILTAGINAAFGDEPIALRGAVVEYNNATPGHLRLFTRTIPDETLVLALTHPDGTALTDAANRYVVGVAVDIERRLAHTIVMSPDGVPQAGEPIEWNVFATEAALNLIGARTGKGDFDVQYYESPTVSEADSYSGKYRAAMSHVARMQAIDGLPSGVKAGLHRKH